MVNDITDRRGVRTGVHYKLVVMCAVRVINFALESQDHHWPLSLGATRNDASPAVPSGRRDAGMQGTDNEE